MRRWRALVIVGGLMLAALRSAAPAHACTPPPGGLPVYTIAEYTAAAPLIFEGMVVAISGQYPQYAAIAVTQYLKGIGPATIAVSGYGPSSVCLSEVYYGQTAIFLAAGDEASGYTAFYLSQFDAVLPADEATRYEIVAASGQAPRTDFLRYTFGTPDAVMTEAMAAVLYPPTPFPYPTPIISGFPYVTDTPAPPTPMPSQMVSALDAVSAASLLLLGGCLGAMAGALFGGLMGFRIGRRK